MSSPKRGPASYGYSPPVGTRVVSAYGREEHGTVVATQHPDLKDDQLLVRWDSGKEPEPSYPNLLAHGQDDRSPAGRALADKHVAEHSFQTGPRGGSYYVGANGEKVYASPFHAPKGGK